MKKNILKSIAGVALATMTLGAVAGLVAAKDKAVMKAEAGDPVRFNILIKTDCHWLDLSAKTYIKYSDTIGELEMVQDSNQATVEISSVTYNWYSVVSDFSSGYNDVGLFRYDSTHSSKYNEIWNTVWREYDVDELHNNVVEICDKQGGGFEVNKWGKYSKVTYYAGLTSYSDLTDATISCELANGWSVFNPSNPSVAPTDYTFIEWCTDPSLSTPYSASTPDGSDITLYAKYGSNTRTISKYAYYDNVAGGSIGSDSVEYGDSYTPSAPAVAAGYVFDDWYFWNEATAATNPFVNKVGTIDPVDDDYDIYAVYKSRGAYQQDGCFYYVTDLPSAEDTPNNIYAFGGCSEFGSWPGTSITSVAQEVHGSVLFEASHEVQYGYTRKIYKIPFTSDFNDNHIIINYNGNESKSADLLLADGAAYWFTDAAESHNDAAGAAISFILELEAEREAVTYSSGDHGAKSICGISAQRASYFVNKYNTVLDANSRAYVDDSYTYTYLTTYDFTKTEQQQPKDNICFVAILQELASKAQLTLTGHPNMAYNSLIGGLNDSNTIITVIIVISLVAVTGAATFFFIKKRKEDR